MPDQESLKQRIKRGETAIGVSVPLDATRSQMEDILAKDSYDFITLDSQHSPYNEEKLAAYCVLAEDLGMPVQFRIKNTRNAYLIGNILDLGPAAIEVPLVEDEAIVDEAVKTSTIPRLASVVGVGRSVSASADAMTGSNTPIGGTTTGFSACKWRPCAASPMPGNWPRPGWTA